MEYLSDYGITDEQKEEILRVLKIFDISEDVFIFSHKKIRKILDLFLENKITNLYGILTTNPTLFRDSYESIKKRLESYENKEELASLINDNPENLVLVDLY